MLTVEVPKDYELGPAMSRLNERQQAFVMNMVTIGGSHTRCAIAAGYAGPPEVVKTTAYRLAHDDKVQAAIKEVGQKMLNAGSLVAVKYLLDVLESQAEDKDKLKAAEMVLNRTGLHATTEHKVAVTHVDETSEQTVKRIEAMAQRMGLDPAKLLGNIVTDAEFEEVEPEDTLDDIYGEV